MVENVMSQYRTPGRANIKNIIALPKSPAQDLDWVPVCAAVTSNAIAAEEAFRPPASFETEDIVSEADILRPWIAADVLCCRADRSIIVQLLFRFQAPCPINMIRIRVFSVSWLYNIW